MQKVNSFLKKLDTWHLEVLGILVIAIIMFPILYLIYRDGSGSAIFQFHDQLDETILNYVFPARYGNVKIYEQMMCGIPREGLKPFCIFFVPLYRLFDVYTAFVLQYFIVIVTSFFSMYFCVKKFTGSSVSALIAATLFSFLPVHSIYGNIVMGTPLLILALLLYKESSIKSKIVSVICMVYYALSTSLTLSGWAATGFVFLFYIICVIKEKKGNNWVLIPFLTLLLTYIVSNLDIIIQVLNPNSFVSHRTEFVLSADSNNIWDCFWGLLTNGAYTFEAEARQVFIYIPFTVALVFIVISKDARKLLKPLAYTFLCIVGLALLSSILSTKAVAEIKELLPGMFSSFQFNRVFYFIPGGFYILLGISCAVIIKGLSKAGCMPAYILVACLSIPTFLYLVKDHEGIFYQNVNQINNGQSVTGYYTMKRLYAEDLMQDIEDAIGKDMSTYRIVNIGISPVSPLMHGFYTIDGYSNNYPLEYKKQFREIIAGELELNDYIQNYFDTWGSRCYAFYHEWGNAFMLGDGFDGKINDLRLDIKKMKDLNCQYIFSAGEICDSEEYGLSLLDYFEDESAFWNIWVYEVE